MFWGLLKSLEASPSVETALWGVSHSWEKAKDQWKSLFEAYTPQMTKIDWKMILGAKNQISSYISDAQKMLE